MSKWPPRVRTFNFRSPECVPLDFCLFNAIVSMPAVYSVVVKKVVDLGCGEHIEHIYLFYVLS